MSPPLLPLPPLAQGGPGLGDVIGIVLVLLFIVIPVIAQMMAKMRQPPQPPGGVRPPAGQPRAQPPVRRPAEQALEDEIGEFLRRAARRAGGRQGPPPPPVPPEVAPPRPAEQPAMAQVVPETPLGEEIRKQVAEHLDTRQFDRSAAELGDAVFQADTLLGRHLHDVFDHDLSRLAGAPGESAQAPRVDEAAEPQDRVHELPPTAAAGLAALLSNASTVRQAIVINEILQRPEHRWA